MAGKRARTELTELTFTFTATSSSQTPAGAPGPVGRIVVLRSTFNDCASSAPPPDSRSADLLQHILSEVHNAVVRHQLVGDDVPGAGEQTVYARLLYRIILSASTSTTLNSFASTVSSTVASAPSTSSERSVALPRRPVASMIACNGRHGTLTLGTLSTVVFIVVAWPPRLARLKYCALNAADISAVAPAVSHSAFACHLYRSYAICTHR